ncbi:hypothetical protein THAOC_30123, partial [Thalassiosira oceanica]
LLLLLRHDPARRPAQHHLRPVEPRQRPPEPHQALREGYPRLDCEVVTPPRVRRVPPLAQEEDHVARRRVRRPVHHAGYPYRLARPRPGGDRHLHLPPEGKVRPARVRLPDRHSLGRARVQLLEGHLELVPEVPVPRRRPERMALPAHPGESAEGAAGVGSEELPEDVRASEEAPPSAGPVESAVESRLAVPVVDSPLLLGPQHAVALADFVERIPVPTCLVGVNL